MPLAAARRRSPSRTAAPGQNFPQGQGPGRMTRNDRRECTSVQEAIFYRDQEAAYRAWLAKHPDGWVLNTNRRPNNRYLILHRTSCHTISQYRQHEGTEAFTGGRYAK